MFDPFSVKHMPPVGADYDPKLVILYGGGGHGKQIIDLLRCTHALELIGILDDEKEAGTTVLDIPVLGGNELLYELSMRGIRQAVNGIGGIIDPTPRKTAFDRLRSAGFTCPPIVHPIRCRGTQRAHPRGCADLRPGLYWQRVRGGFRLPGQLRRHPVARLRPG